MSAKGLSSRAIIGEFFQALEMDASQAWYTRISAQFDSNQESETYKWLGMVPQMREWVGGRQAKGFRENGITITNKTFEATLEVLVDELRRDKTGQILVRVRELAQRANAHWAGLLSSLIVNGGAQVCYDGQYFFSASHSEGNSGTQSNAISVDIATTTAPTAGEMERGILGAVQQLVSILDDQGEPFNENARQFLVMVPVSMMAAAASALGSQIIVDSSTSRSNTVLTLSSMAGFNIELAVNPRMSWTDAFAVFRTDAAAGSLIRQEEKPISISALAEGSEEEFKNRRHLYGVEASRNVGYGYWQRACKVTFT